MNLPRYLAASCLLIVLQPACQVKADPVGFGPGDYGANRRAITHGGRRGVSGTFTEPTAMASDYVFWLNQGSDYDSADLGKIWSFTNPTPYVGGGIIGTDNITPEVMVDFGMSYKADPFDFDDLLANNDHSNFIYARINTRAGWSILSLLQPVHIPIGQSNGIQIKDPYDRNKSWRIPRGKLGNCALSFVIEANGDVTESVVPTVQRDSSGNPRNYSWSHRYEHICAQANTHQMTWGTLTGRTFVKRVSAITQPAPHDKWQIGTATLDNSYMKNCIWSGGQVYKWDATARQWKWSDWSAADTNLDPKSKYFGSGIDTGGKDGLGNWVIGFTKPRGANGSVKFEPNRYNHEKVDISLFRSTKGPPRPMPTKLKRAKQGF